MSRPSPLPAPVIAALSFFCCVTLAMMLLFLLIRIHGAPFRIIQLRALQDPLFGVYSQVSAQVRKICTIQNLINSHYVAQHAEDGIAGGEGSIPVHATEHVGSAASLLGARNESHLIDNRKTRGKVRDRPSSVREDVLHIRCACEPVRVMHLSDGAIR